MKINKWNLTGALFSTMVVGVCLAYDSAGGVLVNVVCMAINLYLGYEKETT